MESAPTLISQRLILNTPAIADIPQIVALAANKNISDNTLNLPYPYTENDAIYWINLANQGVKNNSQHIFAIHLKETGAFIGGIGLTMEPNFSRADIGYWIGEPYWNKGYATEATEAIIEFAFDQLTLNKVTAHYLAINPTSGRVMEKAGMLQEGRFPDHITKNGVFHTVVFYGLTRTVYETRRQL